MGQRDRTQAGLPYVSHKGIDLSEVALNSTINSFPQHFRKGIFNGAY